MANILIDDTGGAGGLISMFGSWRTISSNSSVGGSMQYAGNIGGSIQVEFSGTSISFFGPVNTSAGPPQLGVINIDGQTINPTPLSGLASTENTRWYQSHTLSDGAHHIEFEDIKFVFFDYLVVTLGENQLLEGNNVIVDDGDPLLHYEGEWTPYEGETMIVNNTVVISTYSNTTHKARTPGSSATFKFSGTSINVYGESLPVANVDGVKPMKIRYTLDNFTTDLSYTPPETPTMNLLLFSNSSIDVGDHTLTIQLMESSTTDLSLDYIVYTASDTSSLAPASHGPPLRDILIGSIAGGVFVIVFLLAFVVYKMRGRRKKASTQVNTGTTFSEVQPFVLPNYSSDHATSSSRLITSVRKPPLPNFDQPEDMPRQEAPPLHPSLHESAHFPVHPQTTPAMPTNLGKREPANRVSGLDREGRRYLTPPADLRHEHQFDYRSSSISTSHNSVPGAAQRENATSPMPPPPYEQGSMIKGEDGEIVNGRLREFLDRVQ